MAVLSNANRVQLLADLMQDISVAREPLPVLKAAVRAAVDAADDWCDNNAASYNSALPLPFRSATQDQKSRLLQSVIKLRRSTGA